MYFPFPSSAARRHRGFTLLSSSLLALTMAIVLHAGPSEPSKETVAPELTDVLFHKGAFELQLMAGSMFSLQRTSNLRPNFDYAPLVLRLGYMTDDVRGHGFFRGNDEFMLEAIGAGVFVGPGNALGGLSLIYRRNFLSPGAKVIPYFIAGAGGIYSDAFHDQNQRALGTPFEFDLQAGLGARFRLAPQWTVDTEFSYRHLSNAGLGDRNYGTNAIGGMVGVSYGF